MLALEFRSVTQSGSECFLFIDFFLLLDCITALSFLSSPDSNGRVVKPSTGLQSASWRCKLIKSATAALNALGRERMEVVYTYGELRFTPLCYPEKPIIAQNNNMFGVDLNQREVSMQRIRKDIWGQKSSSSLIEKRWWREHLEARLSFQVSNAMSNTTR